VDPDDDASILAANEAFYAAFRSGDVAAMDALWAEDADVACVHPSSVPLHGRALVMASWHEILEGPPPIHCLRPRVHRAGDAAFVICGELVPGGVLISTNVFVQEQGAWRLVHHHAAPGDPPQPSDLN
jgi:ketosteroid isomerase-like protein